MKDIKLIDWLLSQMKENTSVDVNQSSIIVQTHDFKEDTITNKAIKKLANLDREAKISYGALIIEREENE